MSWSIWYLLNKWQSSKIQWIKFQLLAYSKSWSGILMAKWSYIMWCKTWSDSSTFWKPSRMSFKASACWLAPECATVFVVTSFVVASLVVTSFVVAKVEVTSKSLPANVMTPGYNIESSLLWIRASDLEVPNEIRVHALQIFYNYHGLKIIDDMAQIISLVRRP